MDKPENENMTSEGKVTMEDDPAANQATTVQTASIVYSDVDPNSITKFKDVEVILGSGSSDSSRSSGSKSSRNIWMGVFVTFLLTAVVTFAITYPVTKNAYDAPCDAATSTTPAPTTPCPTAPIPTTTSSASTTSTTVTTPTTGGTTTPTTTSTTASTTTTTQTPTTTTPDYTGHTLRDTTVTTLYGDVIGHVVNMSSGSPFEDIMSFKGIPFGKAARWTRPSPPDPWTGTTLVAEHFGSSCQYTHATFNEECLFLNIYSPMDATDKYPVMVWIHGGAYQIGSAMNYPGHILASKGVILVTVNYRLGIFGFASSDDPSMRGNYAMWDQRQALIFVKENIELFGGDPDDITLFGQSAGGSSVGLHLISPNSTGLFHRAILQSGNEMTFWAVNGPIMEPDTYIRQVAQHLDCNSSTVAEEITCLKLKSPAEIFSAPIKCDFCFGFHPVVDGEFVPRMPPQMLLDGDFNDVDIMLGSTTHECNQIFLLGVNPLLLFMGVTRFEFEVAIEEIINYFYFVISDGSARTPEAMYEAAKFMYSPWPNIHDRYQNKMQIGKLCTDAVFSTPTNLEARYHSNKNKVYLYQYNLEYSKAFPPPIEMFGIYHSYDNAYVFGHPHIAHGSPDLQADAGSVNGPMECWSEDDVKWSDYVISLWTSFAKHGDPTYGDLSPPGMAPVVWEPFTNQTWNYLYLTKNDVQIKQNYRVQETAFMYDYLWWIARDEHYDESIHEHQTPVFSDHFEHWSLMDIDLLQLWRTTINRTLTSRGIDLEEIIGIIPRPNLTLFAEPAKQRVKRQLFKPPREMADPFGRGLLQTIYDGLTLPEYQVISRFIDSNPELIDQLKQIFQGLQDNPVPIIDILNQIFPRIDFSNILEIIQGVRESCPVGIIPEIPEGQKDVIVGYLDIFHEPLAELLRELGIIKQ